MPNAFVLRSPLPRLVCAALLLLCASCAAPVSSEPTAERPRPRILVTNDDGIEAEGLHVLVRALAELGEVWVSAPRENQSGSSLSLECLGSRPLRFSEHPLEGAARAVALEGKPVDAAWFGLHAFGGERPFDLVVSGINRGANVGDLAHYSGTIGAALAAAHFGLPAIAVSQDHRRGEYEVAARVTARFAAELLARGARPGTVYSLNVPTDGADGLGPIAVAPMAGMGFALDFREERATDGTGAWRARLRPGSSAPDGSDSAHFLAHRITLTPLRFDWTDGAALAELTGWELDLR